jgi:prepilin-type N-terminal cleavage/methylation domain-containing protein
MDKGFSLVEVLVALALLIGAVVTLAMIMTRSAVTNAAARHSTFATLFATDKIEQLRSLPFDDAELASSTTDTLAGDCEGFFDEPEPGYHRRWSIVPLKSLTGTIVVTVTVSWGASAPQAVLTTLKARRTT